MVIGPNPGRSPTKKLTVLRTDDIGSGMKKSAETNQSKSRPKGSSDEDRTLGGFLWAVFDLHLRQTQRPLPTLARLAIAYTGSLALFSVLLFTGSLNDFQPRSGLAGTVFIDPAFRVIGYGGWVFRFVFVIVSLFFAALVAALPTRSGPVRLFLAGLFLPALTVNLVRLTWGL